MTTTDRTDSSDATGCTAAVVFAADGNDIFARGVAVAMHSALEKLDPGCQVEIYILDSGMSEESRSRLSRVVERVLNGRPLHWLQIDLDQFRGLPTIDELPAIVYSRLLIPDLLPESIQRALYLDGDVLVTHDIAPLFQVALGDALTGAVRDYGIDHTDNESSGIRSLGLGRPYLNGGVIIFDLPGWRHQALAKRVLEYAASHGPLRWQDQEAINAVIPEWLELDPIWNVQLGTLRHPELTYFARDPDGGLSALRRLDREGAILHFAGAAKPWKPEASISHGYSWIRQLLRAGWYSPAESVVWLLGWLTQHAIAGSRAYGRKVIRLKRGESPAA